MKAECGRNLRNSNRGWIKRTIVFLKGEKKLKTRRSREKCSKRFQGIENQMLAKRRNTEEILVR